MLQKKSFNKKQQNKMFHVKHNIEKVQTCKANKKMKADENTIQ